LLAAEGTVASSIQRSGSSRVPSSVTPLRSANKPMRP